MKTIITIATLCLLLTGCATPVAIVKPEFRDVERPVFVCPAPPDVPKVDLYTQKLAEEDIKDPGKIAQYYKADMFQLIDQIKIYEMILEQYRKASAETAKLQEDVKKMFEANRAAAEELLENATKKPAE